MKKISKFVKDRLVFYTCVFFVCCVAGWISEVLFRTIKAGYVIIPGFLHGCYLPIYGFGALIMVMFFEDATAKKMNVFTKVNIMPFVIFVCSTVILSIMEYITHFALEKYLDIELWSYSAHNYNINGRISLKQSVMFGLSGTLFIYLFYPTLKRFLVKITPKVQRGAAVMITLVIVMDFLLTVKKNLL